MKNRWMKQAARLLAFCGLGLLFTQNGCSRAFRVDRIIHDPSTARQLDRSAGYLKAHLKDGGIVVFSTWTVKEDDSLIVGIGERRDPDRRLTEKGELSVHLGKVSLLETNTLQMSGASAAMQIMTGVSVAVTAFCVLNPKACFGSCPTFYASDGKDMTLMAEGFSESISPSLEALDIDALYAAKPASTRFEIQMKNEALETHVVRCADLLAVRRPSGARVFVTPEGSFVAATDGRPPSKAVGPEGDILLMVNSFDSMERFSLADSTNLAERETLEFLFDDLPRGRLGLILGFRESLMTTYLFYQALAYLGDSAGAWLAELERDTKSYRPYFQSLNRVLGGIEVLLKDRSGKWRSVGEFNETGPIARNVQAIELPEEFPMPQTIRLRMTKGLWRLNSVALASVGEAPGPQRLKPIQVLCRGEFDQAALTKLRDRSSTLVTFPGSDYTLVYALPAEFDQYELFLESGGYYLEWIREEWLAEANPDKALQMFRNPERYLRDEAARYKTQEPQMEDSFWRSKYVQH